MASICSLMISEFTDISTDPGCSRIMDSEMALDNSLGLVNTMAPGVSAGHLNQHGPGSGTAPGNQQSLRL